MQPLVPCKSTNNLSNDFASKTIWTQEQIISIEERLSKQYKIVEAANRQIAILQEELNERVHELKGYHLNSCCLGYAMVFDLNYPKL